MSKNKNVYQVVVGNIGDFEFTNKREASLVYSSYVKDSKFKLLHGLAFGEDVTLLMNGEVVEKTMKQRFSRKVTNRAYVEFRMQHPGLRHHTYKATVRSIGDLLSFLRGNAVGNPSICLGLTSLTIECSKTTSNNFKNQLRFTLAHFFGIKSREFKFTAPIS